MEVRAANILKVIVEERIAELKPQLAHISHQFGLSKEYQLPTEMTPDEIQEYIGIMRSELMDLYYVDDELEKIINNE